MNCRVFPGSGIKNEVDEAEICNSSIHDTQVHTTNIKTGIVTSDTLDVSNNNLSDTQPSSINDMIYYSVINDTMKINKDTEEDTDSILTDNNLTENCNLTDSTTSIKKRKRVRRRKPKKEFKSLTELILESSNMSENKFKKPKIIDSYVIPSGRHIRFDNTEKEENNIAKQIVQETSRNESYVSNASSPRDLSTLLALGQSSTPITFVSKQVKNEVKMENKLNNGIRSRILNKIVEDNVSTEKNLYNKEKAQSYENWMPSDLELIPIMTRKPQVKDIIAFKTLKIGSDYTPQISNFIVTEVIDSCAHSSNYTLKIIKGKEEVQVPFGKFSLSEDTSDSHCDMDMFLLNYSQMQEPRLLLL
ncbi:hypothetical protein RF55_6508 [Lasius niger]|uniref:Coilin tudor domain-containing protein n=1 Tax=Lasius niger TaxID=67767 RepID=A0A0J7KSS6_LASNI|nr:hypothetical protein RF55_6508 [Lasius niger]